MKETTNKRDEVLKNDATYSGTELRYQSLGMFHQLIRNLSDMPLKDKNEWITGKLDKKNF